MKQAEARFYKMAANIKGIHVYNAAKSQSSLYSLANDKILGLLILEAFANTKILNILLKT